MFNFDKVIRLTHGAGNGVDKACLMTASNMLLGKGELGDRVTCQCELLRAFIITTNDAMPTELLGKLYGPLVYEILGTKTNNREVLQRRAFAFADWAVREIAPAALEAFGLHTEAKSLRGLPEIVDFGTAIAAADAAKAETKAANATAKATKAAANAANAAAKAANATAKATKAAAKAANATAKAANAAAYAAIAAADAAKAAGNAAKAAATNAANAGNAAAKAAAYATAYATNAATYAADAAAYAAIAAADAAKAANVEEAWKKCPEIILRVAAIGDKRPVECAITPAMLADKLCKV